MKTPPLNICTDVDDDDAEVTPTFTRFHVETPKSAYAYDVKNAQENLNKQLAKLLRLVKDCEQCERYYNTLGFFIDFPVLLLSAFLATFEVAKDKFTWQSILSVVLLLMMATQKYLKFGQLKERFSNAGRELSHLHGENLKYILNSDVKLETYVDVTERIIHAMNSIKLIMPPPPIIMSRCCNQSHVTV